MTAIDAAPTIRVQIRAMTWRDRRTMDIGYKPCNRGRGMREVIYWPRWVRRPGRC
jgi:hypothetical protein